MAPRENTEPTDRPPHLWRCLYFRLPALGVTILAAGLLVSCYHLYRKGQRDLAESIGQELVGVARTGALLLNIEDHEDIYHGPNGIEAKEAFLELRQTLESIRVANNLIRPVYTMRPTPDFDRTGLLEFVVMTNLNSEGEPYVGNVMPASRYARQALLSGKTVATLLYGDEEGTWISAIEPLRDDTGETVAILCLDHDVSFYLAEQAELRVAIVKVAGFTLLGAAFLFTLASLPVVRRIRLLRDATERVAGGDLTQRIHMGGNDELGVLAASFNSMATRLSQTLVSKEDLEVANRQLGQTHEALKAQQAQLVQQEKLAGLGQLAAGVAHEINNPIGYVLSNLTTLAEYGSILSEYIAAYTSISVHADKDDPRVQEALQTIEKLKSVDDLSYILEDLGVAVAESKEGAERVRDIVRGLRDFARPDGSTPKNVDLNQCVRSALRISSNAVKSHCEVIEDWGTPPIVQGFPGELNQVFVNLFINAAQALPEGGQIRVSTRTGDHGAVVEVADTGTGIAPEHLSSIFDPFFTTKNVGEGTGLGLSISHGIIQKHGGTIGVESCVGEGTRFLIHLPAASDVAP